MIKILSWDELRAYANNLSYNNGKVKYLLPKEDKPIVEVNPEELLRFVYSKDEIVISDIDCHEETIPPGSWLRVHMPKDCLNIEWLTDEQIETGYQEFTRQGKQIEGASGRR